MHRAVAALWVTATDPLTFGGVTLLVVVDALLACSVPGRLATKVHPDGGVAVRMSQPANRDSSGVEFLRVR